MNLRRQIERHYAEQDLPPERLREMAALLRGRESPRRRLAATLLPLFAAAACALIAALILTGRDDDPTLAVAREVALNHTKQLAPDLLADDFATLGARMEILDFDLVEPAALGTDGARPVGARYCSLAGRIAAQVRLRDESGSVQTLYAVRDQAAFDRVVEGEFTVDGVRILLWREGPLLFALASSR